MSTAPKVKLLTQPTDVIYSTLFEGDMTWLLPKITSFPIRLFGFFLVVGLFQIFWKYWKRIKVLYSYKLGGDEFQWENKLVPRSGTYLCSMQGNKCRIMTIERRSPPSEKWWIKLQLDFIRFSFLIEIYNSSPLQSYKPYSRSSSQS